MAQNYQKIDLKKNYIKVKHLVLVIFIHFIHISTLSVCGEILEKIKLFKHFL